MNTSFVSSDFPPVALPSLPWNAEQARSVLDHLSRSGLSAAQFSRDYGVPVQQLYVWRHRLHLCKPKAASVSPDFLPVCVEPAAAAAPDASTHGEVELVHPTGVVIRLRGSVPTGQLVNVLRAVGAV